MLYEVTVKCYVNANSVEDAKEEAIRTVYNGIAINETYILNVEEAKIEEDDEIITDEEFAHRFKVFHLPSTKGSETFFKKDGKIYYKEEWHEEYHINPNKRKSASVVKESNLSELIEWVGKVRGSQYLHVRSR